MPENAAVPTAPPWPWPARLILSALYSIALGASLMAARSVSIGMIAPDVIDARESPYNDIVVTRRGNLVTLAFRHRSRVYTESTVNLAIRSS
jgi:hypothetical protein